MEISGILIVDDNEINRDICAMHLEHMGAPLYFADNGINGLKVAREKLPDLILLDIMMPEMDGFTMLEKLKEDQSLAHIPVLMLTAKSETESVVKALNSGANDYLKKPFEEEEMVARVTTLLRNRYLEQRLADDIAAGAVMQQKFLTDHYLAEDIYKNAGIDVAIFNRPYAAISGDFYYACKRQDSTYGFFLGDSCGHGLPAALISMRIIGFLQQIANSDKESADTLSLLNRDITGLMPFGNFVSAALFYFYKDTVAFSNCGQPYPVLITEHGIEEIEHDGMPLGINMMNQYQQTSFPFRKGDKLVIYTDGVIETTNNDECVYGKKRLYRSLKRWALKSQGQQMIQHILDDVDSFRDGKKFEDDLTMIVFERL